MVEKARRRGVYDYLEIAELVEGIARTPAAWDLVVAADVLVYVGDLFRSCARRQSDCAPAACSAPPLNNAPAMASPLGPSRRYAHSAAYIRCVATEAGLDLIVLEETVPRWEKGQPVLGLAFTARLP